MKWLISLFLTLIIIDIAAAALPSDDDVMHQYPFDDDANDTVGAYHLTESSVSYDAAVNKLGGGSVYMAVLGNEVYGSNPIYDLSIPWSFTAWWNLTTRDSSGACLVCDRDSGGRSLEIISFPTNSKLNVNFCTDGACSYDLLSMPMGLSRWNFITLSWNLTYVCMAIGNETELLYDCAAKSGVGMDPNADEHIYYGTEGGHNSVYDSIGHIDEVVWFTNHALTIDEITSLYNAFSGYAYPYTIPVVEPVPAWVSPANGTINNTKTQQFVWNVSTNGCDFAEMYNKTTLLANSSTIAEGQYYQLNKTGLADQTHEMTIRCASDGVYYNTTKLYFTVDTTSPVITSHWPALTNDTVIANGSTIYFNATAMDINLYYMNYTVWVPAGSEYFTNITYSNGTLFNYTKEMTLSVSGLYTGHIKAVDKHNRLSDPDQITRVALYQQEALQGGAVLHTPDNDIRITSMDPTLKGLQYLYDKEMTNWNFIFDLTQQKNIGDKLILSIETEQPMVSIKSEHLGHIISGNNYIDFDGTDAIVEVSIAKDKLHATVILTFEERTATVLIAKSVGELNIETKDFQFRSTAAPTILEANTTASAVTTNATLLTSARCENDVAGETITAYCRYVNGTVTSSTITTHVVSNDTWTRICNKTGENTRKGEVWKAEVWCGDGYSNSSKINSSTYTVIALNITNKFINITVTSPWAWTYQFESNTGRTVTWGINATNITINTTTGLLSDTPGFYRNGSYYIKLNATETGTGDFNYSIFKYIIAVPGPTAVNTSELGEVYFCMMHGNWTNGTTCTSRTEVNDMETAEIFGLILATALVYLIVYRKNKFAGNVLFIACGLVAYIVTTANVSRAAGIIMVPAALISMMYDMFA